MAVNWTNLFTDAGAFIKVLNLYRTLAGTTVPGYATTLEGVLAGTGNYPLLNGMPQKFETWQDAITGWCTELGGKAQERFVDRDLILEELPVGSSPSIQVVIGEMIRAMINASQTIDRSTVTLGSVTADAANSNTGIATILTTKVLDGVTNPGNNMPANRYYAGVDSELGVTAETMTITCTRDSSGVGATSEGSEQFEWKGEVQGRNAYDWRSEGSGNGPTFSMLNGSGMVNGGEFETHVTATNIPDGWTLTAGAATTNTVIDNTAGKVKRGTYSLKLLGSGAATITLQQTLPGGLVPLKRYALAAWVLGNASIAAGTLTIGFVGTGYTPGGGETISLNAAALAALTSYGLQSAFITMPANIPSDMKLQITVTGTLTSGQGLWIDGLAFGPVIWHGGVGAVAVAGGTKTLKNDRFSFTVANNGAGVFQDFCRRQFGMQLPSSGAPTIADSLAT